MLSTRHALEAERTACDRLQVARDSMEQELRTSNHRCAVMQAALDGKTIQLRYGDPAKTWLDCLYPLWDWKNAEYRIKPEEDSAQHVSSDQCCGRCKYADNQEKSCPAAGDKEEQALWLISVLTTYRSGTTDVYSKLIRCTQAEAVDEYIRVSDFKLKEARDTGPCTSFYSDLCPIKVSPLSV